uniref:Triadin n=1 Tax=Xenopus tropicalis TaxID=8364 RepID=A0A803JX22_XENTR
MTENSVEGRTSSTITTVLEGKNGSIHKPSAQVKSVSHDFKTTFKSPVAWLLVGALIVTWSAVIIVVFDLVDYRSLGGSSLNKFRSNPVGIIHEAVDETTDWIYGIYITISDLISLDEERKGHAEPPVKKIGGIQPALHRKAIPKLKAEEEDEPVKKTRAKEKAETKEKVEKKILPKASLKAEKKEKPEKITLTKSEKKEKSAIKPEKKDKTEKEASVKTEKKVKAAKLDKVKIDKKEKAEKLVTPKSEKKEKTEKVTPSKLEKKVKAEQIAPTKLEKKEKTEKVATTKSEKKEKAEKLTPVKVEKTLKLEKVAPVKAEKKEKAEKVVPVKVQKKEKAEKVVPVKDEKKEKAEKKQKAEKVVPVKDEKKDKAEKKQKAEKVVPVKAEKKGKAEKVAPVKPQKEKAEKVTSVKAEKKEKAEKIAPVKAEKKEKVEKIATSKAEKKVEKLAPVKPEKKEKAKKVAPVKSEKKEKTEKLTQDTTEKVKAEKVAPTKLEKKQKAETRAPVKTEKKDKAEKEIIPQEDKKVKVSQVEEKTKDVKAKTSERKVAKDSKKDAKEEEEIKTKPHTKVETLDAAETMGEIKDQYNFCRYVVDLYSHGDASTEEKSKEKPQEKKEVLPQEKPGELKISLPEKKDIPETKETVLEEVTIHEAEDECPKEDYEQVTPQATEKEPPKVMQDHLTAHKDTEESPKKEQEPMTPQIVKDGPPKPVEAEVKTEEKKEGRSQQPAFTGVSTDFGIMPRLIIIMSDSHGRFASRPDVSVDWTKREMLLKKEEKEAEPITQEKMDYIKEAPTTYIIAEAPVQINVTKPPDAKKEIQMEMPVRKLEEGPKEIKTEIPVEIPEEKTKDVKEVVVIPVEMPVKKIKPEEEIPVEMPVKKLKEPEEIPVEIPVEKPKEVSKAKEQEVPLKKPEPKPAEVKKEVPIKKTEPEVKEVKKEVPLKKPEPKPAEVKKEVPLKKPEPKPAEVKKEEPVKKAEPEVKDIKKEVPLKKPEPKPAEVKKEVPVKKPEAKPAEVKKEVPIKKTEPEVKEVKKEVPLKKPEPKPAEVKKEVPLKKPEPKPAEVKKEEPVKKAEPEVKDIKKEVPLKKSEPKPAEVKKDELKTPKAIYEEKTTDKKEDEKHKKEKKADLKETEKKLKTEGKDPLHFFQWVTDEVLSSLNEYGILKFFNTTFLLNTANAVWTFEMPISIEFPTLGEADPLHFFHWAYEKMYSSLNEYAIIPFFNTTSNLLKASQSLWTMEIPMSISYFSLESIDPFRFFHWINEEVQRGLNEYGILSFFNTTSFLNTSCALWTFDMPISFPSFTDTFGFFHWVYEEVLGGLNRYGILNVFNTTTHALWNFEIPFSISFPTLEFTDPLHFFNWIYEETLNGLNNYGVLSLFNITSFWNATHALWDFEIPISITLPTLPSLESIDPLSFFHWIHESVKNGFNKFGIINFFNTTLWNATHGLWNFEMPISLPTLPTLESLDPLYFFEWVFEEIHNGLNKYGILHLFNTTSFWNATFWNFEMPDYKHFPTLESIDPRRFFCWVYEEVHNGLNKYGILNVFNITSFLNAAHDLWAFEIPISISFAWMESIDPIYFFYWVYEEVVRGLNDYGVNFFNTTFLLNATDALWNFTMPISFTFPTLEGTDPLQFFHWVYESLLSGLNEYGIINFFNNTLLNASHALWNFDMPFSISFPTMADIDPYYLFHWIFEEVNNCLDKYGIFSFFNTTSFWNATHALWNFEMPISFPTLEGKDPLGFIRWLYEELLNSLKEYGFPYLFDSTSDEKSPGYEAIEEETAEVHGQ